ncbi:hypothetical protein [Streptomyces xanthochromogenes]|uniref:Translation initiation factor IF-2 n=1 Tax=Streptomyces xanthochromogenes TaxID=67384 RepID=A0ABQ2ZJH7_9ACTN|nr:hypothetical protein [Streptomyces xanthochromogenes]GGY15502.1 hypothetical protein GCM10010326_04020 [Streptomyces xanthochromogenes]
MNTHPMNPEFTRFGSRGTRRADVRTGDRQDARSRFLAVFADQESPNGRLEEGRPDRSRRRPGRGRRPEAEGRRRDGRPVDSDPRFGGRPGTDGSRGRGRGAAVPRGIPHEGVGHGPGRSFDPFDPFDLFGPQAGPLGRPGERRERRERPEGHRARPARPSSGPERGYRGRAAGGGGRGERPADRRGRPARRHRTDRWIPAFADAPLSADRALQDAARQVFAATRWIATTGTEAQRARAGRLLADVDRDLSRLLADRARAADVR